MSLRNALIFCIAVLVLCILVEAFALLLPVGVGWLGLAMAGRLRPSLREMGGEQRMPRMAEWAAVAIGLGGGLLTVISLALVMTGVHDVLAQPTEWGNLIRWSFAVIWAAASGAPLWRRLFQNAGEAALGPCAAGMAAGLPLGIGLFFSYVTLIDPWIDADSVYGYSRAWLSFVTALPSCGLLLLIGGAGLIPAWRGRGEAAAAAQAVFTGAAVIWAVTAAVMIFDLCGVVLPGAPRLASGDAGPIAAAYSGVMAICWSLTLLRLRSLVVRNFPTAAMMGFVLLIGGLLSLIAPGSVFRSDEWVVFTALILFPFVVVSVLLILMAVVPSLRWLNGERREAPPPFSASA